jgi:hypothetical protein
MKSKEIKLKIKENEDDVIVLCEGDYSRIVLEFSSYKGKTFAKITQQWRSATDDLSRNDNWKYSKSQINMNCELFCEFSNNMKDILNLPNFIMNAEELMVNGNKFTYAEKEVMRREGN